VDKISLAEHHPSHHAIAILLLQAGLIMFLSSREEERTRWRKSESRHRMSELAHVNRSAATSVELTSLALSTN